MNAFPLLCAFFPSRSCLLCVLLLWVLAQPQGLAYGAGATCGNGRKEAGEGCDDGNRRSGDGCSRDCRDETIRAIEPTPAMRKTRPRGLAPILVGGQCTTTQGRRPYRTTSPLRVTLSPFICRENKKPIISLQAIQGHIQGLNKIFQAARIEFLLDSTPRWIDDPRRCEVNYATNNLLGQYTSSTTIPLIFVRNIFGGPFAIAGFANIRGAVLSVNAGGMTALLAHEMGHTFGLSHPHSCSAGRETPQHCATTGDQLCSTPADPGPKGVNGLSVCSDGSTKNGQCVVSQCRSIRCPNGETPLIHNLMSYYHCGTSLTSEQNDVMRCVACRYQKARIANAAQVCCQPKAEACDGKDNDCDGQTDENLSRTCQGPCGAGSQRCLGGKWSACSAPTPKPEVCNDKDDDCDGHTDEHLERTCQTPCAKGKERCIAGMWSACSAPKPQPEVCNDKDDDCDGSIDEGLVRSCYTGPTHTAGVGLCRRGTQPCQAGVWGACRGEITPQWEVCNLKDDDCDGATDESFPGQHQKCEDWRGGCVSFGKKVCANGTVKCDALPRSPAPERCNGADDDCDGLVDEDYPKLGAACSSSARRCLGSKGRYVCNTEGNAVVCDAPPPQVQPEICDGKDNDCDGNIDGIQRGCYTGPAGTSGVGRCAEGVQSCRSGRWSSCALQRLPKAEVCNGLDDDCNGLVDDQCLESTREPPVREEIPTEPDGIADGSAAYDSAKPHGVPDTRPLLDAGSTGPTELSPPKQGCGCSSPPLPWAGGVWMLVLLVWLRRAKAR